MKHPFRIKSALLSAFLLAALSLAGCHIEVFYGNTGRETSDTYIDGDSIYDDDSAYNGDDGYDDNSYDDDSVYDGGNDSIYGDDMDLDDYIAEHGGNPEMYITDDRGPGYSAPDYWGVTGWYMSDGDDECFLTFHNDGQWEYADIEFNRIHEGTYHIEDGAAVMTHTDGTVSKARIPEYGTLVWSVGDSRLTFEFA